MKKAMKFSNAPKLEVVRPRLVPRHGARYQALLVGGPADRARELTEKLAAHGVDIVEHRPVDKPNVMGRPLPTRLDLAIVLVDMCSHNHTLAVAQRCEVANPPIPCIRTQRKMARLMTDLRARGVDVDHPAAKPVEEQRPSAPEPPCELQVVSGHVNQQPVQEELPMTMTPQPDPAPQPALKPMPCMVESYLSDGRRYLVDYHRRLSEHPWTAKTDEALVLAVEAHHDAEGAEFLAQFERLTGLYRTAGTLSTRLMCMASMLSVDGRPMCRRLDKLSDAQTVAKRCYLKTERALLSHGKTPVEMVSKAAAVQMVGGVPNRLKRLHSYMDVATGIIFFRYEEVVATRGELLLENLGELPDANSVASSAKRKMPALIQGILHTLAEKPASVGKLASANHSVHKRVEYALARLLCDGKVKELTVNSHGAMEYALADWVDVPKEKKPAAPRPPAPEVQPATVQWVAPVADILPAVEVKLRCKACKTPNREGARFCCGCGANLQPPVCGSCKSPLQPEAFFCDRCGTKSHWR